MTAPRVEFTPLGPLWVELLVFGLALAVFAFSVYATKYQPTSLRLAVSGLRGLLLLFALALIHNPVFTRQTIAPVEPRLAVLVDRSGSMGAETDGGRSRYEVAFDAVRKLVGGGENMDVFEFDQGLSEPLGVSPQPRKLSGAETDFYGSLTQLFTEHSEYSGVLMLSDGHDLGRFSQMSLEETKRWLERLNAPPINTALIGNQLQGPEVAIHSIDAPSFSFVRAPLRLRATVIVRNLDGYNTQVQLLEGEKVIQVKDLTLDEQGFGSVEFEFYPEETGEQLYTIQVPAHHLEANVENNTQQALVEIGRDKINVLHIAGSITWDLQGLRAMFERNPMVDLTAFYIMRTREHIQQGVDSRMIPPEEMALVPFPTEEIFDRQLFGFDVVVFHDFDAGTYVTDSYQARRLMQKLREYVTEHRGGFVVIGGPRSAAGPSLGITPVAGVLPLTPPVHRAPYDDDIMKPNFTGSGAMHPILRNFDREIQTFSGAMNALAENKEANVLIRDENDRPLLATLEIGNGRTLFLNTSSSWQWRRDALAAGSTGEGYYDFWDQALKWMIQDPSLNQVRLTTVKTTGNPLAVEVDALLRDENYRPARSQRATLRLSAFSGKVAPLEQTVVTDSKGSARTAFQAEAPGYYRVEIVEEPWRTLSKPVTLFLGGSQDELRNLDLAPETLQRLSSATAGKFAVSATAFEPESLAMGQVQQRTIVETNRLKLRHLLWCLPLLLLIVGLEWAMRRSRHLA